MLISTNFPGASLVPWVCSPSDTGNYGDGLSPRNEDAFAPHVNYGRRRPTFADHYRDAKLAIQKNEWHKAIVDLGNALDLNPDYCEAHWMLGLAHDATGEYELAADNYTEVIRIDPRNATGYCNRGAARGKLGDYEHAISDLIDAIRLAPDYAKAYYNLGVARGSMKQYQAAIDNLMMSLDYDPQNAETYYHLGVAHGKLDQDELALHYFNKALELNPQYSDARYNRTVLRIAEFQQTAYAVTWKTP